MIDRLISFLKELPAPRKAASSPADDPRIAAAALMFHVIDADGIRHRGEAESLRRVLSTTYGIEGAALDELLAAGEKADREAVDLYAATRCAPPAAATWSMPTANCTNWRITSSGVSPS